MSPKITKERKEYLRRWVGVDPAVLGMNLELSPHSVRNLQVRLGLRKRLYEPGERYLVTRKSRARECHNGA